MIKLFDTLIVFLKEFLEKLILKNISRQKIMKNYPACKEFTVLMELFGIWLVHLGVFSFVNIAKSLVV